MNPIKQFIIRGLKESNTYEKFLKNCNKKTNVALNSIHFQTLLEFLRYSIDFKSPQLKKLLNRMEYYQILKKPICVLDVSDACRMEKYLTNNGILWNNGSVINDLSKLIKLNGKMSIVLLDRGKIQFSTSRKEDLMSSKSSRFTFFEEEEFYEYYDKLREEIFKQFKTLMEDVKY